MTSYLHFWTFFEVVLISKFKLYTNTLACDIGPYLKSIWSTNKLEGETYQSLESLECWLCWRHISGLLRMNDAFALRCKKFLIVPWRDLWIHCLSENRHNEWHSGTIYVWQSDNEKVAYPVHPHWATFMLKQRDCILYILYFAAAIVTRSLWQRWVSNKVHFLLICPKNDSSDRMKCF